PLPVPGRRGTLRRSHRGGGEGAAMNDDPSPEDRRRSPRVAVDVPVRVTVGHEAAPGRLRDICRDAALVELHRACTLGEEALLAFELAEEDGPIQVTGTAIRLAGGLG